MKLNDLHTRLNIVLDYLDNDKTANQVSILYGIKPRTVRKLAKLYRDGGLEVLRKNIGQLKKGFCNSAYLESKLDLENLPKNYRDRFEGQFYQSFHEGLARDLEAAADSLRGRI